jgi:uncharacterized protein (DUF433 family)
MSAVDNYLHLEYRPGSLYRQPFIKGTRIRVEIPYGWTIDKEDEEGIEKGQTPEQVAADFNLPVEAVLEAIDYCQQHWDVVCSDHAREERIVEATGMNHPNYKYNPKEYYRLLSPQELARLDQDDSLPR